MTERQRRFWTSSRLITERSSAAHSLPAGPRLRTVVPRNMWRKREDVSDGIDVLVLGLSGALP